MAGSHPLISADRGLSTRQAREAATRRWSTSGGRRVLPLALRRPNAVRSCPGALPVEVRKNSDDFPRSPRRPAGAGGERPRRTDSARDEEGGGRGGQFAIEPLGTPNESAVRGSNRLEPGRRLSANDRLKQRLRRPPTGHPATRRTVLIGQDIDGGSTGRNGRDWADAPAGPRHPVQPNVFLASKSPSSSSTGAAGQPASNRGLFSGAFPHRSHRRVRASTFRPAKIVA